MKNKFLFISAVFCVVIILLTCFYYFSAPVDVSQKNTAGQIVALNEINHLIESGDTDSASAVISQLEDDMRRTQFVEDDNTGILLIGATCLSVVLISSLYIYFAVLRPFDKLKGFAENIAQGNFDVPLKYERSNYFGKFTWAFDSMRNEITKSRQCEKEAIGNNKTVIATLSHDIKTPIASIRAYTEGLQANMDSTTEKREK